MVNKTNKTLKLILAILISQLYVHAETVPNPDKTINNAAVEQQEKEIKVNYLISKANKNFLSRNFKQAANQYLEALSLLSNNFSVTKKNSKKIEEIKDSLSLLYTNWAEDILNKADQEYANGNIEEAIKLAREAAEINPKLNSQVEQLIENLKHQQLNNKFNNLSTDTKSENLAKDKQYNISVMFEQGKILFQKNQLDRAKDKFEEILAIEPLNTKAVYYVNLINQKLYKDGVARSDEANAKRIAEVAWASVRPSTSKTLTGERIDLKTGTNSKINKSDEDTSLEQKLNDIIVPHISFDEVPVADALMFLKEESKKLDPTGEGINLVLELPPRNNSANQYNVTITESNIPLRTAIEHICKDAGVHFAVKKYAVFVSNTPISANQLVTKVFPAEREKFGTILVDAKITPSAAVDLQDYFKIRDITFGEGASIVYDLRISRIIVRNTPEEIVKVKKILDQLENTVTPQVSIASKFIEIQQTDFDELGFQWSINKPNSNVTFPQLSEATRDTVGIGKSETPNDRLFGFTVNHNNLSVSATLHALAQSSTTETLSSPRVTTLNGYTTVIRVVTERYFPESWSEPKLVTTTANDQESKWLISSVPTFGSATDVGIVFKVTPFVCSDNYTIDLVLEPIVQAFIRWNEDYTYTYEYSLSEGNNTAPLTQTYTQQMPVIGSRAIKTRMRIYDGDTVVIGGALNDRTTKYNDKIPIIGDFPLFGRFFQSEIEDVVKTNLLIFTTVRLVMPDGTLLRPEMNDGRANFQDTF